MGHPAFPACTAIWEVRADEAPLWRYWGPRLPDGVVPPAPLREERPEPSFSLHHDMPLSLFPGIGMGWFGAPVLAAHRAGRDWTHAITRCRMETPADDTLRFHLVDDVTDLAITIAARLDPASDVLTLSTTLTNIGKDVLDVHWLAAACLPLPSDAHSVLSYTGRHNSEFVPVEDALPARAGGGRTGAGSPAMTASPAPSCAAPMAPPTARNWHGAATISSPSTGSTMAVANGCWAKASPPESCA
jgi:alpha-galactosidase